MKQIPRPEHPRPDFFRPDWMNLNGEWQFAFDEKDQGLTENWQAPGKALPLSITVPFAHQTPASGLNDQRISNVIWYKRAFLLPETMKGRRVLLRFGAVDFRCQVYVNGALSGAHEGGYTPFALDVTRFLQNGENEICVRV